MMQVGLQPDIHPRAWFDALEGNVGLKPDLIPRALYP
jgi:hypothetical protein